MEPESIGSKTVGAKFAARAEALAALARSRYLPPPADVQFLGLPDQGLTDLLLPPIATEHSRESLE